MKTYSCGGCDLTFDADIAEQFLIPFKIKTGRPGNYRRSIIRYRFCSTCFDKYMATVELIFPTPRPNHKAN